VVKLVIEFKSVGELDSEAKLQHVLSKTADDYCRILGCRIAAISDGANTVWIRMLLVRVRYRWCAGELVPRRQPAWLPDLVSRAIGRLYAACVARDPKARFALAEGH
jgi:hypothetical protein